MTYRELLYKVQRLINHNEITLGEYDKMTKPLDEEVRKTGKWIKYEKDFTESGTYRQIKMPVIECSICQEKIAGHIGIMNYCPNCGADMRGAENESK